MAGENLISDLLHDLRHAARMFSKSPGFTAAAVLTLALSIGANTAIFSLAWPVLARPLPFRDPSRLVMVWEDLAFMGFPQNTPAPANFVDWKTRNHVFVDMAAMRGDLRSLTGDGQPEEVQIKIATANTFSLLGMKPVVGRVFLPEEDQAAARRVVLVSRGLWVRRYGANPRLLGKAILINGEKYTVVGVLPQTFDFPERVDLWLPMAFSPAQWRERSNHFLEVVARLRPGVTVEQATNEMAAIGKQLEREYPETNTRVGTVVIPLHDQFVGNLRSGFIALLAAVAGVLLIACANIANLLLARATGRRREMAMRLALGAKRSRLVRQVLAESVLLAALGGFAGVLLASWTFGFLTKLVPLPLAATAAIGLDGTVIVFSICATMAAGILFGMAPALHISTGAIGETLKQGWRATAAASSARLRGILVVAEVSLGLVLLIGTGLMLETVFHLGQIEPGFRPDHVLCLRTSLNGPKYADPRTRVDYYSRVLAAIAKLPGILDAGFTTFLPFTNGGGTSGFVIEGRPEPPGELFNDANHRVVTPHYLTAIGARLIAGRFLRESDGADAPLVALINQTMAAKYWPGEDPIGKRFKLGTEASPAPWITIVGITRDIRQMGLDQPARPEMYFSYRQPAVSFGYFSPRDLAVRVAGDPLTLAPAIRRVIAAADKDQPVSDVRPMEELLAGEVSGRQVLLELLSSFAALALILVAVGVYGVLAYDVRQRTGEIGVRMALGARQWDILRSFLANGARLIAAGLAAGLAGAWALTRVMQSLLYGVAASDPATFAGASLFFLLVGLCACYFPARRAARIDPLVALRYE